MTPKPKTPHRSPRNGRDLKAQLLATYTGTSNPAALALIDTAAQALDEALMLEAVVKRDGPVVVNRTGSQIQHPALVAGQAARNRLDRVLRGILRMAGG
jgi:hypothetical protein